MNQGFAAIGDVLKASQTFAVLTHVRPEGDAMGWQLAMVLALQKLGKTVVAYNEDGLPDTFAFLIGSEIIVKPPAESTDVDVVLALDTAAKNRLGTAIQGVGAYKRLVNIDHHASNPGYAAMTSIILHDPPTRLLISLLFPHPH